MSELRMFSEAFSKSKGLNKALRVGSMSDIDAKQRYGQYKKLFSNYENLKDVAKTFSGMSEIPLLSNQYFNATVTSYVQSFAGFLSIERAMDQPTMLLYFMNVLGVTTGNKVLPNLGEENLSGIGAKVASEQNLVSGTSEYSIASGKKLLPGSVSLVVIKDNGTTFEITDDRKGNLLASPGILEEGSVNYSTGAIELKLGSVITPDATDKLTLKAKEDAPANPEFGQSGGYHNRFKMDMDQIAVSTVADMLIGENNIAAMASAQKAIGIDPVDFLTAKLIELYTKLINEQIVGSIVNNYDGNITELDVGLTFADYRSKLDKFSAELVHVDTALAKKSVKGIRATSYVVGTEVADWFRKCKTTGNFVDNVDSTYINDLLGYFNGVPVLRHASLPEDEGYAVHKTMDGNLAPVAFGQFLPLTNTPAVGNYNNPTQVAQGVYFQQGIESISTDLVQKFTVKDN